MTKNIIIIKPIFVLSVPNLLVILKADNNDLLEGWTEFDKFGLLLLLLILFCIDCLGDEFTGLFWFCDDFLGEEFIGLFWFCDDFLGEEFTGLFWFCDDFFGDEFTGLFWFCDDFLGEEDELLDFSFESHFVWLLFNSNPGSHSSHLSDWGHFKQCSNVVHLPSSDEIKEKFINIKII